MPDWLKSMTQTFEYYIVDPDTWFDEEKIDNVTSSVIDRDLSAETRGSATIDITESVGECYVRIYLITIQNGKTERFPLGTFLVQTPSSSFDGKIRTVSMDAYTPLIELKEKMPPLGYYIEKNMNVMRYAYDLTCSNLRAPVVKSEDSKKLYSDFVANSDDTWLVFISDLLSKGERYIDIDEMGNVLFAKKQDTAALQPVWEYTDDNSSILYSDIKMNHDLYGIPNVVEVLYSQNNEHYYSRVVNNNKNSPISTANRGREIIHRVTNPELTGEPTAEIIKDYANQLLEELSTVEYTITYYHGYCPVRIGDCVRINYRRAGITDIKAKVISQSIECKPGCKVTEKAVFTTKLWR